MARGGGMDKQFEQRVQQFLAFKAMLVQVLPEVSEDALAAMEIRFRYGAPCLGRRQR